ncbi:MAG: hypothetical protein GX595_08415, partial [Lentisphaerae bacterium]|nr:hypothetical protein [Lentisphaerota bacterium]
MATLTTRVLLAFVLFTLGFGVGREVGRRQAAAGAAPGGAAAGGAAAPVAPATADKVMVYYLHATFRCVTCNTIEAMAKEVVETQFAEDLAAGRIEWYEGDFQVEEDLAKRFDVVSSCVVVARRAGGKEAEFQRLDEVWTLVDKPAEFKAYVA